TRRRALQHLSAGALLGLGLWPGALRAGDNNKSGSFRFVVINDTHYMSDECGRWLEGVIRQVKSHEPIEFCLHAGDLTEHGRGDDFGAVREIFNSLGLPTYVVIGNHDYLDLKFAATEPGPAPRLHSPKDQPPSIRQTPPQF